MNCLMRVQQLKKPGPICGDFNVANVSSTME